MFIGYSQYIIKIMISVNVSKSAVMIAQLQIPVCAAYSLNSTRQAGFETLTHIYLCTHRTHKGFNGTVVNRALPSVHSESIKITSLQSLKVLYSPLKYYTWKKLFLDILILEAFFDFFFICMDSCVYSDLSQTFTSSTFLIFPEFFYIKRQ